MILSMKVLLLGAAVTTATATATAQGTTRTTGTERTVHAGDYVTTITVDGTATTITDDVKSVTAAPGAKVKVTAAPPQQGKRARLVITKAASSSSGQGGSGNGGDSGQGGQLQNIPVRGIEIFNPTGGTVFFVGTSYQFKAKVLPENATNKSVSWSVSDLDASGENTTETNNYATIDDSGLLDCLAAGKVRIFAMSEHNNSIVGTCDIEVKDPNAGGSGQQGGENGGGDQPQTGENGGGQGTGEVTPGDQGGITPVGGETKINFTIETSPSSAKVHPNGKILLIAKDEKGNPVNAMWSIFVPDENIIHNDYPTSTYLFNVGSKEGIYAVSATVNVTNNASTTFTVTNSAPVFVPVQEISIFEEGYHYKLSGSTSYQMLASFGDQDPSIKYVRWSVNSNREDGVSLAEIDEYTGLLKTYNFPGTITVKAEALDGSGTCATMVFDILAHF